MTIDDCKKYLEKLDKIVEGIECTITLHIYIN